MVSFSSPTLPFFLFPAQPSLTMTLPVVLRLAGRLTRSPSIQLFLDVRFISVASSIPLHHTVRSVSYNWNVADTLNQTSTLLNDFQDSLYCGDIKYSSIDVGVCDLRSHAFKKFIV
jgi:hypothetical protein